VFRRVPRSTKTTTLQEIEPCLTSWSGCLHPSPHNVGRVSPFTRWHPEIPRAAHLGTTRRQRKGFGRNLKVDHCLVLCIGHNEFLSLLRALHRIHICGYFRETHRDRSVRHCKYTGNLSGTFTGAIIRTASTLCTEKCSHSQRKWAQTGAPEIQSRGLPRMCWSMRCWGWMTKNILTLRSISFGWSHRCGGNFGAPFLNLVEIGRDPE
jgi:hypothetical protein